MKNNDVGKIATTEKNAMNCIINLRKSGYKIVFYFIPIF